LLLLVPRSLMPYQIEAAKDEVQAACAASLSLSDVEIEDSQSWYTTRFETSGSWESWIWDTVCGRDFSTREPHFKGYVVMGESLGKAGAGIVQLAMRMNKVVLSYDGEILSVVSGITSDSEEEFGSWFVSTTSIEAKP